MMVIKSLGPSNSSRVGQVTQQSLTQALSAQEEEEEEQQEEMKWRFWMKKIDWKKEWNEKIFI